MTTPTFTDEDLKWLKEKSEEFDWSYNGISSEGILALLARLEAAEKVRFQSSLMLDMHDSGLPLTSSSTWNVLRDLNETWRKAAGK